MGSDENIRNAMFTRSNLGGGYYVPVVVFLLMIAAPLMWLAISHETITPEKIGPWVGGAASTTAIFWALLRAREDDRRRREDLVAIEARRLQEILSERQMAASTLIVIVSQDRSSRTSETGTGFTVNLEVRNTGTQPFLEIAVDALWLVGPPHATLENYVLHPVEENAAKALRDYQMQLLEPRGAWCTTSDSSDPLNLSGPARPSGWTFMSPAIVSGCSINPVGDVVAQVSFMDNTGTRWVRIGLDPPVLEADLKEAIGIIKGQEIWPAPSTLTIQSVRAL